MGGSPLRPTTRVQSLLTCPLEPSGSSTWYQPLSSPTILAVSPGRRRPRIAVAVEGPSRTRTALDPREIGTTSSAKTDVALRLKSKSSLAAKRLRVSIKFSPDPDRQSAVQGRV